MLVEDLMDTEDAILARELELMVYQYKIVGSGPLTKDNCHNCAMSKEVAEHKENLLEEKDLMIEDLKRRLKIIIYVLHFNKPFLLHSSFDKI